MSSKLDLEKQLLEERKVKSLEKIAKTLDALVMWFEEIDKEEWNERIQFYLAEFLANTSPQQEETSEEKDES